MDKINRLSLAIALFFTALTLHAQEPSQSPCDSVEAKLESKTESESVELLASFTKAMPLERPSPRYPSNAARAGAEGWVQLSYVVDQFGNVKDPIVEDSGGHRSFGPAAISAIKKWTFEPATQNGETIEQCKSALIMEFSLADNKGATRKFINRYRSATKALKSEDIEEADKILQKLLDSKYLNRYENAWVWSLDAQIAAVSGDNARELAALRKAINSSKTHSQGSSTFNDSFANYLYSRLFMLEVQKSKFSDAQATLKKINKLKNSDVILENIAKVKDYMDAQLSADEALFVEASIPRKGVFFHRLVRQNFGFANIEGQLTTVEVRCDTKREIYTVAPGNIWKIPKSWGQCQVLVSGEKNSKFDLVEVVAT